MAQAEGAHRCCVTTRPDLGNPRPPLRAAGKRRPLPRSGQFCAPGCVLSVSVSSVTARTCADEQGQGSTLPNHTLSSLVTRETGREAGLGGGGLRPQLTGLPGDPQPAVHVPSVGCEIGLQTSFLQNILSISSNPACHLY